MTEDRGSGGGAESGAPGRASRAAPPAPSTSRLAGLAARLDRLYEFDREPVRRDQLQSGARFAALFAGEHVAGTEFVIGAMFVLHGVSARDLLLGLLLGNLLAVLSWTLICAPIAVRTRVTLYWYVRRIAGPGLMVIYNLANAFLYCILAGAMISVAATAVGIPFGIAMPSLGDSWPNSAGWVLTVLGVGAVAGCVAVLGFKRISQFSALCVPWMFLVFVAGAAAVLPRLGEIHSLHDLWGIASTRVWDGVPREGQEKLGFWHIVFFAWFCNLAMHAGLSDMALFRYARSSLYGLYSSLGMYLGHYLAWICSGVMVAAYGYRIEPGPMAYSACGAAGAVAVVIAGWTTANPTVYRAGLALQIATPGWPRWATTLAAFGTATVLACFPAFVMNLLDFVAIYGIVLMPVGAVVFAEHWIFPRIGLRRYWAEERRMLINWPALITWAAALLACWWPMSALGLHLFFRWLPGYLLALVLYPCLAALFGAGRRAPRGARAIPEGGAA